MTYLKNEFGHFFVMRYGINGAKAPMRKKNRRARHFLSMKLKRSWASYTHDYEKDVRYDRR